MIRAMPTTITGRSTLSMPTSIALGKEILSSPLHIIVFHSAFGLRPAVHAAADRLRAAGHEVHVPDLYDGRTTDTVEEGMAIKDEIGRDELLMRAVTVSGPLSDKRLVYAGFSLGGSIAQNHRAEPGARR
jgi:dienelactone hydrolase